MKCCFTYDTKFGKFTVVCTPDAVTEVRFGEQKPEDVIYMSTALTDEVYAQLEEYFRGERREFTLPLCPEGTQFQKKVWEALCRIPYGETQCYQEIAEMVGSPKAFRAVGMANHNNPIPILIPCHRVVGKDGSLTGYAGGLEMKKALLEAEKNYLDNTGSGSY